MLQGEVWGGPSCRQTRLPRDRTPPAACVGRRNRLVCQSRGARRRSRATRARAPQRGSASHARAAPRFVWSRVRSARIETPQHTEESGTLYQQRALSSTLALLLAVVKHKPGVYDARRGTTDPTHPATGPRRRALGIKMVCILISPLPRGQQPPCVHSWACTPVGCGAAVCPDRRQLHARVPGLSGVASRIVTIWPAAHFRVMSTIVTTASRSQRR